jgi:pilus assembly protein FimV
VAATSPPAPDTPPAAQIESKSVGNGSGQYTVHEGESLSRIASQLTKGKPNSAQTQTWMLAIYQANPQAFNRNMNVLHAGAVLRMPEQSDVEAVSPSDAAAEIHRQYVAWHGSVPRVASAAAGRSGRTSDRGQLQLVTPSEPGGTDEVPQSPSKAQPTGGGQETVEGSDSKRLLQLHDSEMANLQARMGDHKTTQGAELPPAEEPAASASAHSAGESSAQALPSASEPPIQAAAAPTLEQPARRGPSATLMETALNTVKDLWWVAAVVLLALLSILVLRSWRSRQQAAFDDSLGRLAMAGAGAGFSGADSMSLRNLGGRGLFDDVDDTSTSLQGPAPPAGPLQGSRYPKPPAASNHTEDPGLMVSDPASLGETGGDPLAEADFHMAYGLYDQAADLIRFAISREPERRDLKAKLLEVYFVWNNKDQFLQTAHALAQSREDSSPGEWEKILIMGKQIAPEDPLFADDELVSGVAVGGVDLALEEGDGGVDFDLLGEHDPSLGYGDLRETHLRDHEAPEYDFSASLPPTNARQMTSRARMETPEQGTAELPLSELGLEDEDEDGNATMVAGFDERSRRVMEAAAQRRSREVSEETSDLWDETGEHEGLAHVGEVDTARLPALGEEELDVEDGTMEHEELEDALGLDGMDTTSVPEVSYSATQPLHSEDLALPDVEPATMSEVGTKLDLARAYLDMGDPDGARNILEEVLHEGSASQRQEAQRLMESLPG